LLLVRKPQARFALDEESNLVAWRGKSMAARLEGGAWVVRVGWVENSNVLLLGLGLVGDAVLGEVDGGEGGEGGHDDDGGWVGVPVWLCGVRMRRDGGS